jgi:hypothetical protein
MTLSSRITALVRDVAIVFGAFALALGIFQIFRATQGSNMSAEKLAEALTGLTILTMTLAVAGFTIVACLAPGNRWQHLVLVGIVLLPLGVAYTILFEHGHGAVSEWLGQAAVILLFAGIGGGFSYIFRR